MKVAAGLDLPLEAVTETFAILAVRRAGKSSAAVVMGEAMYDAGLPWVAVDPKGDWHGVRSSADGKKAGLAVPVFGGLHSDLPLEPGAGAYLADLVAEKRLTCVLDISEMAKGEQTRFLVAFAERLLKVNREPLHLFLEEADEYLPQRVEASFTRGDMPLARVVGAVGKLVRRGGFRGIGTTLISQRSAVVNKDVLTQVGTLVVLRTTSPQDRKAISDWVKDKVGGADEMLASLPSLANGEAWVWSPEFLQTTKRVQFRRRRTFDSGATPKVGEKRIEPTGLADIDLAAIKEAMGEYVARADAQDPKILHRRIRELEAELAKAPASTPEPEVREVRVEVPVITAAALERLEALLQPASEALGEVQELMATQRRYEVAQLEERRGVSAPRRRAPVPAAPVARPASPAVLEGDAVTLPMDLTPAKQRILDALAWLESVGIGDVDKAQLALLVDQSPRSGTFANYLGSLRSPGLLAYPAPRRVGLTEEGRALAVSAGPRTTAEMHEMLFAKLGPTKARILRALIEVYPESLRKEDLAERVGQSPTSGTFANYLGSLRSLGLIDYPAPGSAQAQPVLFLEDSAGV